MQEIVTLYGSEPLSIKFHSNGVMVNHANIIDRSDIKACNGRIHKIDSIVMPERTQNLFGSTSGYSTLQCPDGDIITQGSAGSLESTSFYIYFKQGIRSGSARASAWGRGPSVPREVDCLIPESRWHEAYPSKKNIYTGADQPHCSRVECKMESPYYITETQDAQLQTAGPYDRLHITIITGLKPSDALVHNWWLLASQHTAHGGLHTLTSSGGNRDGKSPNHYMLGIVAGAAAALTLLAIICILFCVEAGIAVGTIAFTSETASTLVEGASLLIEGEEVIGPSEAAIWQALGENDVLSLADVTSSVSEDLFEDSLNAFQRLIEGMKRPVGPQVRPSWMFPGESIRRNLGEETISNEAFTYIMIFTIELKYSDCYTTRLNDVKIAQNGADTVSISIY